MADEGSGCNVHAQEDCCDDESAPQCSRSGTLLKSRLADAIIDGRCRTGWLDRVIDGRRISGTVLLTPLPDREQYYVGITGRDADGQRWQLAWPGIEHWQWYGTPLERFVSAWP